MESIHNDHCYDADDEDDNMPEYVCIDSNCQFVTIDLRRPSSRSSSSSSTFNDVSIQLAFDQCAEIIQAAWRTRQHTPNTLEPPLYTNTGESDHRLHNFFFVLNDLE